MRFAAFFDKRRAAVPKLRTESPSECISRSKPPEGKQSAVQAIVGVVRGAARIAPRGRTVLRESYRREG